MSVPQIVLDTNVIVAALRSSRGASYRLLMLMDSGKFVVNVSVPLILEYEDAIKRLIGEIALTARDLDDVLDYICAIAQPREIYYLWRPLLKDPRDDMVLELAVSAQCECIVTYNQRHLRAAERFGIRVLTPKEFLEEIGGFP